MSFIFMRAAGCAARVIKEVDKIIIISILKLRYNYLVSLA